MTDSKKIADEWGCANFFSPAMQHDSPILVADRAALITIRDAIDAAISNGSAYSKRPLYSSDGEGYALLVIQSSAEKMMDDLPCDYRDEIARSEEPWPHWLKKRAIELKREIYERSK